MFSCVTRTSSVQPDGLFVDLTAIIAHAHLLYNIGRVGEELPAKSVDCQYMNLQHEESAIDALGKIKNQATVCVCTATCVHKSLPRHTSPLRWYCISLKARPLGWKMIVQRPRSNYHQPSWSSRCSVQRFGVCFIRRKAVVHIPCINSSLPDLPRARAPTKRRPIQR